MDDPGRASAIVHAGCPALISERRMGRLSASAPKIEAPPELVGEDGASPEPRDGVARPSVWQPSPSAVR